MSLANLFLSVIAVVSLSVNALAQHYNPDYATQRSFACVVYDAQSMTPLSMATLHAGRYGWSSDEAGHVEAMANIGDTLVFTHVGYLPAILEVKSSFFAQNIVAVKLSPDTVMLSEVVVKPRRVSLVEEVKGLAEAKRIQEVVARENFSESKYIALSRPKVMPTWDANDNQRQLLAAYTNRVENAGMVSIGVDLFNSTKIMNLILSVKRRSPHNVNYHNFDIKPLSSEEEALLFGNSLADTPDD